MTSQVTPQMHVSVEGRLGRPSMPVDSSGGIPAEVSVHEDTDSNQEAVVAAAKGLRLFGWAMDETDTPAARAVFRILNGETVAGGVGIVRVKLGPNQSAGDWFGPDGIKADDGLTIERISGKGDIYLYHKTVVNG